MERGGVSVVRVGMVPPPTYEELYSASASAAAAAAAKKTRPLRQKTDPPPPYDECAAPLPALLLHKVTNCDTLAGLSLRYAVSQSAIRRANQMCSDRLNSYLELRIPAAAAAAAAAVASSYDERHQREKTEDSLRSIFSAVEGMGEAEAQYYLAGNGWALRSALRKPGCSTKNAFHENSPEK